VQSPQSLAQDTAISVERNAEYKAIELPRSRDSDWLQK